MIERYAKGAIGDIWKERNEFEAMMKVEVLASEAQAKLGVIPEAAAKTIKEKANFDVERIHEIEKETNHDIISFVTAMGEYVGDEARGYIHLGLTSTDVKDTALGYMMKQACDIILEHLKEFREVLKTRALEFKYTPCVGRTHGVHGEPTTFGLKLLLWMAEMDRNIARMERAKESVSVGKLSGAVGTYSNIDPFVEEYVCKELGLTPSPISTQVIQRDRHAELMTTLAVIASSLDKFATEIRHLQRTEVREAEEYFSEKQKGSSAMPHKRNPITCERVSGLARVVRGNAVAALEDVALWHERDISHSSVERIILPDSTIAVDYMTRLMIRVVGKLLVYPETMKRNLEFTGGLIFSQTVLTALVDKGAIRDQAYRWVQKHAMGRWLEGKDFQQGLLEDENIRQFLSEEEIKACFDEMRLLRHVDTVFARFGM